MPGLRKNTLGRNKFFGYQKERIIKCQQVSCKTPKPFFIHLCEAPDFDKGQDCWPPRDSVFIPMCNKRYISKPQNKEIGSVSEKTDTPMLFFLAPHFSGWIPIWSMDAIPRKPSYSASFSPLIFLLHYPFLISLYICNYICIFPRTPTPSPPSNSLDPPGLDPSNKDIKLPHMLNFFSFLVAFPLFYNMLFIYNLYQDLNFKSFQRTGWGEKNVAEKMSDTIIYWVTLASF